MTNQQIEKTEKDIAFCIDILEMTDEQIGEMLRVCDKLGGISAEYFCDEFIFECEPDEVDRIHDDEYLSIAEFNGMYWEGN